MLKVVLMCSLAVMSLPLLAANPSYDCGKASHEIEQLICSDDELAALDVRFEQSLRGGV